MITIFAIRERRQQRSGLQIQDDDDVTKALLISDSPNDSAYEQMYTPNSSMSLDPDDQYIH